jgi:Sec-independent protein translocase protein TatA
MPGFVELMFILAIIVIALGARRLPALGEALGKAIDNYRASTRSRRDIKVEPKE